MKGRPGTARFRALPTQIRAWTTGNGVRRAQQEGAVVGGGTPTVIFSKFNTHSLNTNTVFSGHSSRITGGIGCAPGTA